MAASLSASGTVAGSVAAATVGGGGVVGDGTGGTGVAAGVAVGGGAMVVGAGVGAAPEQAATIASSRGTTAANAVRAILRRQRAPQFLSIIKMYPLIGGTPSLLRQAGDRPNPLPEGRPFVVRQAHHERTCRDGGRPRSFG